MKVIEIFDSIDGEGIRTGQPCTFIRLAGCNLRCSYCDTVYALFGEDVPCEYTEMTVEEIVACANPKFKRITLTGGEPLIHKDVDVLIDALLEKGYEINVETNGAADIRKFRKGHENLFFTVDYKLPSSNMEDKMLWDNFVSLKQCDVIKFVVGSDEDLAVMIDVTKKLTPLYENMPHIFAGVVYGEYEPLKLINAIMNEPVLKDVRYQIQLHKQIWDPDERGV